MSREGDIVGDDLSDFLYLPPSRHALIEKALAQGFSFSDQGRFANGLISDLPSSEIPIYEEGAPITSAARGLSDRRHGVLSLLVAGPESERARELLEKSRHSQAE